MHHIAALYEVLDESAGPKAVIAPSYRAGSQVHMEDQLDHDPGHCCSSHPSRAASA